MTLSSGLIAAVALAYMAIMFSIAFYGDRRHAPLPPRMRAWVYSLSLAVIAIGTGHRLIGAGCLMLAAACPWR